MIDQKAKSMKFLTLVYKAQELAMEINKYQQQ